jgi:E3 Ubiquitin ligase
LKFPEGTMTENIIAIIAWLGGAFFCGILPLGFAAILFFTSRKRGQAGLAVASAQRTTAAALKPGPGLVRLEGNIAPRADPIDGPAENALVYLRLKVEVYERDEDSSGWRGLTDKARGIAFQIQDGTGAAWVDPEGLDKQLLGDGIVPDENQIQAACILLGISPKILRGQLRFRLWELRAGQKVSIVGQPVQGQSGLLVKRSQGQPFVVSPLVGQAVETQISTQAKKARTWTIVLGIPGAVMLVCTLGGALFTLVRTLMAK